MIRIAKSWYIFQTNRQSNIIKKNWKKIVFFILHYHNLLRLMPLKSCAKIMSRRPEWILPNEKTHHSSTSTSLSGNTEHVQLCFVNFWGKKKKSFYFTHHCNGNQLRRHCCCCCFGNSRKSTSKLSHCLRHKHLPSESVTSIHLPLCHLNIKKKLEDPKDIQAENSKLTVTWPQAHTLDPGGLRQQCFMLPFCASHHFDTLWVIWFIIQYMLEWLTRFAILFCNVTTDAPSRQAECFYATDHSQWDIFVSYLEWYFPKKI